MVYLSSLQDSVRELESREIVGEIERRNQKWGNSMEKDAERATSKLINKQSPKDVSIVSEPTEKRGQLEK